MRDVHDARELRRADDACIASTAGEQFGVQRDFKRARRTDDGDVAFADTVANQGVDGADLVEVDLLHRGAVHARFGLGDAPEHVRSTTASRQGAMSPSRLSPPIARPQSSLSSTVCTGPR